MSKGGSGYETYSPAFLAAIMTAEKVGKLIGYDPTSQSGRMDEFVQYVADKKPNSTFKEWENWLFPGGPGSAAAGMSHGWNPRFGLEPRFHQTPDGGYAVEGQKQSFPLARRPYGPDPRPPDYEEPPDPRPDPAPTPVSRVQAPTTSSHYTGSMHGGGYAPMYGEQGVVVDFANEASKWQKAAVGRDDLSYFRAEMPSQPTDWYRRSLRFPLETQRFSRVPGNGGVPPFDPSGPGSDVGCMVPCIGAAAAAAMVF